MFRPDNLRRHALLVAMAALLAVPQPAGAVLFQADFDDGQADGFTAIGPGWEVSGGTYNCETNGYEIYSSSLFGDPLWDDVIIHFDIRATGSVNHLLRFRVVDFEDFYVLNLRSSPWNDVSISRRLNTATNLIAADSAGFHGGSWHSVMLVLSGFQFEVYLDGDLVLQAHDLGQPARLRTGQCALVSYSGGVIMHQVVNYDNILVLEQPVAVQQITWSGVKQLFQ